MAFGGNYGRKFNWNGARPHHFALRSSLQPVIDKPGKPLTPRTLSCIDRVRQDYKIKTSKREYRRRQTESQSEHEVRQAFSEPLQSERPDYRPLVFPSSHLSSADSYAVLQARAHVDSMQHIDDKPPSSSSSDDDEMDDAPILNQNNHLKECVGSKVKVEAVSELESGACSSSSSSSKSYYDAEDDTTPPPMPASEITYSSPSRKRRRGDEDDEGYGELPSPQQTTAEMLETISDVMELLDGNDSIGMALMTMQTTITHIDCFQERLVFTLNEGRAAHSKVRKIIKCMKKGLRQVNGQLKDRVN